MSETINIDLPPSGEPGSVENPLTPINIDTQGNVIENEEDYIGDASADAEAAAPKTEGDPAGLTSRVVALENELSLVSQRVANLESSATVVTSTPAVTTGDSGVSNPA